MTWLDTVSPALAIAASGLAWWIAREYRMAAAEREKYRDEMVRLTVENRELGTQVETLSEEMARLTCYQRDLRTELETEKHQHEYWEEQFREVDSENKQLIAAEEHASKALKAAEAKAGRALAILREVSTARHGEIPLPDCVRHAHALLGLAGEWKAGDDRKYGRAYYERYMVGKEAKMKPWDEHVKDVEREEEAEGEEEA